MKNIIYIAFTMLLGLGLMTACEEEADKVIVDLNGDDVVVPVISNSATGAVDISIDIADEVFELIEWSAADYGAQVALSYTVQFDINDDFSTAVVLATTEDLSTSTIVSQINEAALGLNAEVGVELDVYINVISSLNGVSESSLVATNITRTITPYDVIIEYPEIYVPGAYQGWSPGEVNGRLYSYGFDSKYEGILKIVDANAGDPAANTEFKIAPEANWDNAWGGTLASNGNDYSGTLDGSGGNFSVIPGIYEFTVDVTALTIEMVKTDDWGIIGDATSEGWDADTDMFYNGQRQFWTITTDLTVGEFKFRANDGWDLDLGDNDQDGSLDAGGANIPITIAGNYTITLDIINNTYSVEEN